jgi:hypothetical protein
MKPFYVVLLMGAAAVGGGLVVRYTDHPVEITLAHSVPPTVVAPPVPPSAHVGPSSSVPVLSAPPAQPVEQPPPEQKPPKKQKPLEKPSALASPDRPAKPDPDRSDPRSTMRVKIPPEPPAVIPVERSTVPAPPPPAPAAPPPKEIAQAKVPEPVLQPPPRQIPAQEANHATLKAGMLIVVRVNEALSSNLNSKGDVFSGTLEKPLIADGFVIAERGARVRGEVVDSKSAGRESELVIRLREILASDGQYVHVVSEPWRKPGTPSAARSGNIYDAPLTRDNAAVIRPATSITFRLDQPVELTEKR